MSTRLLERLRSALRDKYRIEHELGAGGMGTVFLAHDLTLDRPVAIKILRPELATAEAAERFLREARILASLNHPNVVPVHTAGEADGIFYYVMDFIDGRTLAERLLHGPLPEDEAVDLADGLLRALDAAHARDVVHRDVKPGNIFLMSGRAILTDFGIAKPTDDTHPPLTGPGQLQGTPTYMAPEQFDGKATPRTDVYAAGMVLYEMFSGRRWVISGSPGDADWTGVPRRWVTVLKRALAWSPEDRWESAAQFRAALAGRGGGVRSWWKVALGVGVVLVGLALLVWFIQPRSDRQPPDRAYDLVLLPVDVLAGGQTPVDGGELARWVAVRLDDFREVQVVPPRIAFPWWEEATRTEAAPGHRAARELGADYAAYSRLVRQGSGWSASLEVYTVRGKELPGQPPIRFGPEAGLEEIGDSLTLRLLRFLRDFPESVRLTGDPDALRQFILGEDDFERCAWEPAVQYYEAAVEADPTFALAWWRLANAWRWTTTPNPYPYDFHRLLEEHGADLDPADRAAMGAQLTSAGPGRFDRYDAGYLDYPSNDFIAFLYGEDLFNRGPLWGIPLDSAVALLETAIELNPYWASSYVHLIWADIRLGQPQEASRWLSELPEVAAGAEEGSWLCSPELLRLALGERFEPKGEATLEGRRQLIAHPVYGSEEWLAKLARLGGAFDIPHTQFALGEAAVARAAHPAFKGGGHLAQALGLLELGRAQGAVARLDSAAIYLRTREARFQAAEAPLILSSLGLIEPGEKWLRQGRRVLLGFREEAELGDRASWALALEARARGDSAAFAGYADRVTEGNPLRIILDAARQADAGLARVALGMTRPLLGLQAVTAQLCCEDTTRVTLRDPFARSLLHLLRGGWHEALGERDDADREWLWYEATDIPGLSNTEPLNAGEIDWALSAYARYRRGLNDHARGEDVLACRHLSRVIELWSEPEGAVAELAGRARATRSEACS